MSQRKYGLVDDVWIGMQDSEDEAIGDCGCTLYRSANGSDDPSLSVCRLHDSADQMLAEIVSLLDWFDLTKDEDNMARLHGVALDTLRELRDYIIKGR